MSPPLPPSDLSSRIPEILLLPKGAIIERLFSVAHDPIHFDRSASGRFNAPDGSYGVLYAAESLRGAFAETFLRAPGRTLLPLDFVMQKARIRLRVGRDLKLARLIGSGLARLGATAEVVHGGLPYDSAQSWSKSLRAHPAQLDGVAYRSRHDDDALCYALFSSERRCVEEASRETGLEEQDWFWREVDRYGMGIAP